MTRPDGLPDALPDALIVRLRRRGLLPEADAMPLAGGRSNRVWRIGDRVLKLYDPGAATPLFANDAAREASCLTALSGTGLAPAPVAADPGAAVPWVLYHHLPGACWTGDAAQVAQLLGRLHRQPPPPDLPPGPDGSADLRRQGRAILALCPGAADLPEPVGDVPPSGRRALVHGDPVPGNIVIGAAPALIDWQCPVAGDPTGDLAIFLSPAMQLVYRGRPLDAAECAAFRAAYPDAAVVARYDQLTPWYHWRMAAYCRLQAARGHRIYAAGEALERAALAACQSSSATKSLRPTET